MTATIHLHGLRTENPLNRRKHWRTVHRQGQNEIARVSWKLTEYRLKGGKLPALPVLVRLVRISPSARPMDDDGVAASLKHCRDTVANHLDVDDGDRERIRFSYASERGEWGVRIEVEEATP